MYRLFYSPGACSLAPHIALEEIGAKFELARLHFDKNEQGAPEYLRINPMGRVPALQVGDQILTETHAILTYLGMAHPEGAFLPTEAMARARVHEVMNFLSSSLHGSVAQVWRSPRFSNDAAAHPGIADKGKENLRSQFGILDGMVKGRAFVAGASYSFADPYLLVIYRWGLRIGLDMKAYRELTQLTDQALARPAVQRAMARENIVMG